MSAILKQYNYIEEEIRNHPAWIGHVSGLVAEKMLCNLKTPYLYVLREGENKGDYYITHTQPNGLVVHRPFIIMVTPEGWYYRNTTPGGPFTETSIDDVLHVIMHCKKEECVPFTNFKK